MTNMEIILLPLLVLSLVLLIVVFVYYRYYRQCTRERFAFRVFLLISSLSATLIMLIFSRKTSFAVTLALAAQLFGLSSVEYEPTLSDKLLAVVLILGLIYLAIKLHRNWPGEISIREHQAKLVGLTPGILGGTIAAVADLSGKLPLETYSMSRQTEDRPSIVLSPSETKAWHLWVARILQLASGQLHIDELKDWYADKQLFIARYGQIKFNRRHSVYGKRAVTKRD